MARRLTLASCTSNGRFPSSPIEAKKRMVLVEPNDKNMCFFLGPGDGSPERLPIDQVWLGNGAAASECHCDVRLVYRAGLSNQVLKPARTSWFESLLFDWGWCKVTGRGKGGYKHEPPVVVPSSFAQSSISDVAVGCVTNELSAACEDTLARPQDPLRGRRAGRRAD